MNKNSKVQIKLINKKLASETNKILKEQNSDFNNKANIFYKIEMDIKNMLFFRKLLYFASVNFEENNSENFKFVKTTIEKIVIETNIYNTFILSLEEYDTISNLINIFSKVTRQQLKKIDEKNILFKKNKNIVNTIKQILYIVQKMFLKNKYNKLLKLYSIIKSHKIVV